MRRFPCVAPLIALALSGCLATKDDVRLLQLDIARLDTLQRRQADAQAQAHIQLRAQAEAAEKARFDSLLTTLQVANDSIRVLTARLMGFQASMNSTLHDFGLVQVQILERAGLNQRELRALNARIEANDQSPGAVPGDTTAKATGPGPDLLFSEAKKQLDGGAYATGRDAFLELIRRYPAYTYVSSAVFFVAHSYEGEGNVVAADSVYQLVFTRYPQSPDAPNAMYKHGMILQRQGKLPEARAVLQRVITEYPTSDAASLAKGALPPI
jgi:tol-pal system protein YbgF